MKESSITTVPVNRLSIPINDFGLAANRFDMLPNMTKRERKTLFKKMCQMLVAFGVVSSKCTVHSIASGMDAAGAHVVEITYTYTKE